MFSSQPILDSKRYMQKPFAFFSFIDIYIIWDYYKQQQQPPSPKIIH